jgi:CubicO group peptidase (beta-lactamase class C family)
MDVAVGSAESGLPLTPETVLIWMSAGKPLLAAGLVLLREHGALDWDDPVVRFLPEFGVHGKDQVTLRHLLDHQAGFRQADPIREVDWAAQVAAVCAARLEPSWETGAKTGYHTAGSWTVLGAVLERIVRERLGSWMRREVFGSLGMQSTSLGASGAVGAMHECRDGACRPHPFWSVPAHLEACWPGSNTFSTARDMAAFYQALLDGGAGLWKESVVREWTSAAPAARPDASFKRPMRFHLGLLHDSKQPGESWHSYGYGARASARTFGHSGNQCSCAFADPERGLVVALVFNGMPGEPVHQARVREVLEAVDAGLER